MISRRQVFAAPFLACTVAAAPLWAQPNDKPISSANNFLMLSYQSIRNSQVPSPDLLKLELFGADGAHHISELKNKIYLVVLWNETDRDSLVQLSDMTILHSRYANDKFGILAIKSGGAGLDYSASKQVMSSVEANGLPLWVEPNAGDRLAQTYAATTQTDGTGKPQTRIFMPCVLVFDQSGRVRGRFMGFQAFFTTGNNADAPQTYKSPNRSIWASPDADAIVQALISGEFAL